MLLMDEPFGALDAMTRDLLHDELEALWTRTGLTVLFVTHNVREAVRLGNRVVLLTSRPGRIAEEYPVEIRPAAPHRLHPGRRARGNDHRPAPRGGASPWRPSKLSSPGSTRSSSSSPGAGAGRRRIWAATWPKLGAIVIALLLWQIVVWSGWKPDYLLPGPVAVFQTLFDNFGDYVSAAVTTLQRAAIGFGVAVVIGTLIGALVVKSRILRSAVGSMITGLMTMPSIAWFPAAIVLFGLKESAILFVIVIGAAPSVANGFIAGVDNTPPILVRAARMLGARGLVVVPPRRAPGRAARRTSAA